MYSILTVSRITAISESMLRAWELRFGFPQSTRTSDDHRLYSQEEIARLKWVKTRLDEGMAVHDAILALRFTEEQDACAGIYQLLTGNSLEETASWLMAALQANKLDDVRLILDVAQEHYPLDELILKVIAPALRELGQGREEGDVDETAHHCASNFLRLYLLAYLCVDTPTYDVNPIVLACAPGELPECSLLMFGVLLRLLGWPVVYLGQSVCLPTLSASTDESVPSAIVIFTTNVASANAFAELPKWLPQEAASGRPLVYFGGQAFVDHPEMVGQVPGVYLGDTIEAGVQKMDAMLRQLYPSLQLCSKSM